MTNISANLIDCSSTTNSPEKIRIYKERLASLREIIPADYSYNTETLAKLYDYLSKSTSFTNLDYDEKEVQEWIRAFFTYYV